MPISKRTYNQNALEFWYKKLGNEWEHYFTKEQLTEARGIYRQDKISALELRVGDAIVYQKIDRQEYYAFVEWENGKLDVRISTEDKLLGYSLAAAGIYEIEELVADEISPLPYDPNEKRKSQSESKELEKKQELKQKEKECGDEGKARVLLTRFKCVFQGVTMAAFWINADGKEEPALLHDGCFVADLSVGEREKLIRLTSMAHKGDFRFDTRLQCYVLRDPQRMVNFGKRGIELWSKYFKVEVDKALGILEKGVQRVSVGIDVSLSEGKTRFNWQLKLGDSILHSDVRDLLMKRWQGPVFVPGLGLLKMEEKQAAFFAYLRENMVGVGDCILPKYMIFSLFGQDILPVTLTKELEQWRDRLSEEPEEFSLPDFLRPYQKRGVRWLRHVCQCECHALLADEMGLGKTVQVASLIACSKMEGKPQLIVCPASVVPVWKNEIEKFYPELRVEVLKKGNNFATCTDTDVIWVTSYTQLRRHKSLLEGVDFGYAVLDEAQFIKNPDAKVTVACMSIRADHRIVMTGTPLENKHLDLWTIFRFLMPGLLGGRRVFEQRLEEDGDGFLFQLSKQINPFVLRRTKSDVIKELPSKMEMELVCPLSELQAKEYKRLTGKGLNELGNDLKYAMRRRPMGLLTLLTRLRQLCCDPGLLPWLNSNIQHSGKLNCLYERMEAAIIGGHKIVVFSQFVSLLKRAKQGMLDRFEGVPVYELTGKTTNRELPVRGFQTAEGAAVILVSLKAGGTGITLHSAEYVFLLDPWWNPAVEEQAIDRVHRIGQQNNVFVYRMVTEGTIEQRIEKLKAKKRDLFDKTVGNLSDVSNIDEHFTSVQELIELISE